MHFKKGEIKLKIHYKARNIEISDAMKNYFEKKVEKIERIIDDPSADIEVKFEKERESSIVEATLKLRSIIIRAKETTTDFYASIDGCIDTIEKRFKRLKERYTTLKREKVQPPVKEVEEEEQKIVKVKKFVLSPIDVNEAIVEMEMLGHQFFVFRNVEDGQINVLYKREDGNYGLIIPQ
ncbi:MAG: ribosomal subunit interface protein [Mesoaciditoga sp.]|nr:MAG: ribosomal subunit interface protein [Mesoaciditoga sp.]PMP80078.1 MAG: ribosomal subunit interface protein [Mesoaciditoga sp.]